VALAALRFMRFFFRVLVVVLLGVGLGTCSRMLLARHEAKASVAASYSKPAPPAKTDSLLPTLPVALAPGAKVKAPEPVRVSGYVVLGRRVNVVLSDGRTLTELDPELKKIHRNAVFVGEEKFFMKQPKDKELAPAAPPASLTPPAVNAPVVDSRPSPPAASASSWVTYSDGVSRLVDPPHLK